ncbi:MarR family winged helix-turn-helix transcriptional regulator [Vibrio nigripulchritudo]|uniref:MarR family winged helix-turn-helix transcriptional regulator n=1 Tax=Vibrio nigripulchritudo TaxID=28173 RepID=UPI0003B24464|nr:MarR family transcriptional regulator [Vibrio nigripulchritudo]CCN68246.1 putative marR-family regulatory protein [Vibrio nigripulchritudo SFn118]
MKKTKELYELIWASRPLMQAAEVVVEKGLAGTGLTVRMRAVLEVLHNQGGLAVPEIAHYLDIKRQYVQVMVNETLKSGFTEKTENPRHKRSSLISLTQSGRDVIRQVMEQEKELLDEISTDLPEKDITAALSLVKFLVNELKAKSKD